MCILQLLQYAGMSIHSACGGRLLDILRVSGIHSALTASVSMTEPHLLLQYYQYHWRY